ncbi:hypothetical protein JK221_11290 [Providencia sp. JGM172]|uniref:Uncharacterized protein n=1 Tax=Providencia alcalifaciens TaxID=126385 RepID=A0A4R3NGU8_9GAMM|nr:MULTISPECIES: winged helix-turn-helix domain-containing protein [Providencia]MBS0934047.1 hypothetical protein [Providencia sp. JGM172]MBS0998270.1 hypothetical protein [Providencia sp. JGM178]TCT30886.1 hypothetical protein EC835_10835 [Providencia alcalifaciens]
MNNTVSDKFLELTDSLSKYRRATIENSNGENIVESLYVDPLENDLILKSMLKNNTTLLIGRKGTGKSTIINRFQHEIRKSSDRISLYVDVKSLFEQTKKSNLNSNNLELSLSVENKERLDLYVFFIDKIIEEIKNEIKSSVFKNKFVSLLPLKITKGITKSSFEKELDSLFNSVRTPYFSDATGSKKSSKKVENKDSNSEITSGNLELSFSSPSISAEKSEILKNETMTSKEAVNILTRFFDIIGFMNSLKSLLKKIPINGVFICLDDMSEIDKDSMEVFTDFIVGPLNNLSDEYFKFKISLYPGRDFLPSIDRQKVKTHNLDYYDLYSQTTVDKVEEQAINYTNRLLNKRFDFYFKGKDLSDFFELSSSFTKDDLYKLIFQISSNVPRIIGKTLEIAHQKTNGLNTKISRTILREAAKQHYKNDIEYVLTKSEYIEYRSYNEAFEQYHLLDLLNKIIDKAILNKSHIGMSDSAIFKGYTTNTAPSNYLYIPEKQEDILKTLEFNFFITKYNQQKDKDKDNVSIFTLNYGLCVDNNIIVDVKSDRKFRVQRIFDYGGLLNEWMNNSKELICISCEKKYDIGMKDAFIKYNMPCPNCQGNVELRPVINENFQEKIDRNVKIPEKEYQLLNALKNSNRPMTASELAEELDCAYQAINHRVKKHSKVIFYKFVIRDKKDGDKAYFSISEIGKLFLAGMYEG